MLLQRVVYLDVLLFLNAFITALLLLASATLLRQELRRVRLLLGTLLGGALSLVIFLPEMHWSLALLMKLIGCVLLVWVTFGGRDKWVFLRTVATFLLANFLFAGVLLALWTLLAPRGMLYQNGALYFDVSVLTLTLSTVFCYAVTRLIAFLTARKAPENHAFTLTIEAGGQRVTLPALFDSGSALREGFSGAAVIVCEAASVRSITPPECSTHAQNAAAGGNLRLIPYHSVGGAGVLPAFRAELAQLRQGKRCFVARDVYIAVHPKTLARGEYTALVGSVFFEQCAEEKSP
ncbi:MAG: sigma-E processing peptidase SpoIIGA [Oscillospiraceae bacterium]|jgi:stage II sporulation protein GA (sporulation sigma-E factor processing peptidase)|nr:sigma-E processing peptidase SpoIIGA [Oscillospiraceae bacterium]